MVLPEEPQPFPVHTLARQVEKCRESGLQVEYAAEAFRHMDFYDMEAFIWFARVIPWEFPGFSVENCREALEAMEKRLAEEGKIRGTTHRFCIAARRI